MKIFIAPFQGLYSEALENDSFFGEHENVQQRRQSGLKSGGSWIRVKMSIFRHKFPRVISILFRQYHKKFDFPGKFLKFFWQFKKNRFPRQELLIYSYFW